MKAVENDYVILKATVGGKTKKVLARVTSVNKSGTEGHALGVTPEPEGYPVNADTLLCVLGPELMQGNVLGVKLEAFYREQDTPLGSMHWYFKPEKEARVALNKAIKKVHEALTNINATSFLPVQIEVRRPKGKYAGFYHYNEQKGDKLVMLPKSELWRNDLEYVVAHECGHGVWYRLLNDKQRAAWTKLYHESVKITQVTDKDLKRVLSHFEADEANGGYISTVRGQLEEEDVPIYDAIVDYVLNYHHLGLEELDVLAQGGYDLSEMWPTAAELTDVEPLVTDYGTLNVKELFAESFSIKLVGMKLPKKVDALMERTYAYLKKRGT